MLERALLSEKIGSTRLDMSPWLSVSMPRTTIKDYCKSFTIGLCSSTTTTMMMMGDWLLDRFISTQERTVWFCDRRSSIASRRVTWKRHTTLFKNCCLRIRRKKEQQQQTQKCFPFKSARSAFCCFCQLSISKVSFFFWLPPIHAEKLENNPISKNEKCVKNYGMLTLPTYLPTYLPVVKTISLQA